MAQTSDYEKARIITAVAAKLGVPNIWLDAVVKNESGYNPIVKNPASGSSARGLIQFVNSTAKWLGYSDSLDLVEKHPDFSSQMWGPVLKYFQHYAPYNSFYEFSMAPFMPALKFSPPDTVLSARVIAANTVGGVPLFTVTGDYADLLKKKQIDPGKLLTQKYATELEAEMKAGTLPRPPAYGSPTILGLVLVAGALAWLLLRRHA